MTFPGPIYVTSFWEINPSHFEEPKSCRLCDEIPIISGPFGPVIFSKKTHKKRRTCISNPPHDEPIPINKLHTPTFPNLLGTLRHHGARGHHVHLHVDFGRTCFHHQKERGEKLLPLKLAKHIIGKMVIPALMTGILIHSPKTNMAPENGNFGREIPFGNYHFLVSMLGFGGVMGKINHYYWVYKFIL